MPIVTVDGSMLQFYSSGILDGTDCSNLNHVVSFRHHHILKNQVLVILFLQLLKVNAIGYRVFSGSNSTISNSTMASNTTTSKNYWILKNEWGTTWGEVSTLSSRKYLMLFHLQLKYHFILYAHFILSTLKNGNYQPRNLLSKNLLLKFIF